ncbi:hypothetical protein SCACP_34270 [Sporomusa carbonis]|uniref:tetratricopeptide repeat-containing glycosyltransferase family 2 protein n=1 Tax=Sporomusa carbonis TaxID=3076075 RepID=UPI003A7714ED
MSKKYIVSLCMIVKDEENVLAACLDSVRHLIDEIIIVDTGSTDSTPQIAAANGAMVIPFTWCDDFAAARNHSLSQASGDWILVMDADERLEPVASEIFQEYLDQHNVEGYYLRIHSLIGDGSQSVDDQVVRLFRNKPHYRFIGRIHEQVAGSILAANNGGGLQAAELTLLHHGYLKQILEKKQKQQRNIAVIEATLAATPHDPFLHYSLAMEYIQAAVFARGEYHLRQALHYMSGQEGYCSQVIYSLFFCLYHNGKLAELSDLLGKFRIGNPTNSDITFFEGLLALATNDQSAALDKFASAATQVSDIFPYHSLCTICAGLYTKAGQYQQAINWYYKALEYQPSLLPAINQILTINKQTDVKVNWNDLASIAQPPDFRTLSIDTTGNDRPGLFMTLLKMLRYLNEGNINRFAETFYVYRQALDKSSFFASVQGMEASYITYTTEEMGLLIRLVLQQDFPPTSQLLARLKDLILSSLEMLSRI